MHDEIKLALCRQHHAALTMLKEAITVCPPDLWTWGEHPRTFWRIAYHAAGYCHLYLYENLDSWKRWEKADDNCAVLEGDVEEASPYSQQDMIDFVNLIESEVDERIQSLDLTDPSCGFRWYPNVTRFELLVLSLRHLHGHIGQLHELLIARDLDVKWLGQVAPATSLT